MSRDVFLDTAALVALTNADDWLHAAAARVDAELNESNTPLVTSDLVLTEYLNALSTRRVRRAAIRMVDRLASSKSVRVESVSRSHWLRALDLFRKRPDKDWSLVDCSSMLICEARSIEAVFTSDHHFAQAGFKILL